ncbi:MAG: carbohydrate ABC transporter permease [Clostridia bacterium]|nr:carbohydrate ABC transporter permease [Clostridia bacterium]
MKTLTIKTKKTLSNMVYHLFMIILSVTMVYPFIWSGASSFKKIEQLYTGSPLSLLPNPFTLENYHRLFEVLPFGRFTLNSLFLSVCIPIAMIAVASLSAYALTRLEFPGRNIIFIGFIATMMIPSHVVLIPNYRTIVDMHLYNTFFALFLTSMFTSSNAFNIFFFRQFFLTIPKDLESAAIIDGCSYFTIFFRIILPNSQPALATTAILSFRTVWNQFLWPMIVINDYNKMTLTVGLKYLKEWEQNWAVLLSGASLSIIPIVIVFLIFQKQFMSTTLSSGFGGR